MSANRIVKNMCPKKGRLPALRGSALLLVQNEKAGSQFSIPSSHFAFPWAATAFIFAAIAS